MATNSQKLHSAIIRQMYKIARAEKFSQLRRGKTLKRYAKKLQTRERGY